jgi:hypothetical protein
MSDRPDLDKAIEIAQAGGLKITGGKYAPTPKQPDSSDDWLRTFREMLAEFSDQGLRQQEYRIIEFVTQHDAAEKLKLLAQFESIIYDAIKEAELSRVDERVVSESLRVAIARLRKGVE